MRQKNHIEGAVLQASVLFYNGEFEQAFDAGIKATAVQASPQAKPRLGDGHDRMRQGQVDTRGRQNNERGHQAFEHAAVNKALDAMEWLVVEMAKAELEE